MVVSEALVIDAERVKPISDALSVEMLKIIGSLQIECNFRLREGMSCREL